MWSTETALFLCAPQQVQDRPNTPCPEFPSGTRLDVEDGLGRIPAGPYYSVFYVLWYHPQLGGTSLVKPGTIQYNSEFTAPIPMMAVPKGLWKGKGLNLPQSCSVAELSIPGPPDNFSSSILLAQNS